MGIYTEKSNLLAKQRFYEEMAPDDISRSFFIDKNGNAIGWRMIRANGTRLSYDAGNRGFFSFDVLPDDKAINLPPYDYIDGKIVSLGKMQPGGPERPEAFYLGDVKVLQTSDGFMCQLPGAANYVPLRTDIRDIREGDAFAVSSGRGQVCVAARDSHQNLDEPDEPRIVYDSHENGWFEEDILTDPYTSAYFPPARNLSLDQVLGILDEEIHATEILSSTDKNQKQREARSAKLKTMRFVSDLLQHRAEQYAATAAKAAPVIETDKSLPAPSADLLQQEDGTVRLWARVGMSLDVSPETYTRLKGGDKSALTAVLQGKEGRVFLNGETYFPDIEENKGLEDMEFNLFAAIHPQHEVVKQLSKSPLDAKIQDAKSRSGKDKLNNEKEPER